jgi:hypothetical protein
MPGPVQNTDRELFREDTGDPAGSHYENSVYVTAEGAIGMNVGGLVIVMPIAKWHKAAIHAGQCPEEGYDELSVSRWLEPDRG